MVTRNGKYEREKIGVRPPVVFDITVCRMTMFFSRLDLQTKPGQAPVKKDWANANHVSSNEIVIFSNIEMELASRDR